MHKKIFMLIDDFNATIDIWINALQHYSFEKLLAKPDAESWSLGQVYMHIIDEAKWYIGQIEICLSDNENADGEMKEGGIKMFANNEFPDIKIKGDPVAASQMPQPPGKEKILNELSAIKQRMNELWKD